MSRPQLAADFAIAARSQACVAPVLKAVCHARRRPKGVLLPDHLGHVPKPEPRPYSAWLELALIQEREQTEAAKAARAQERADREAQRLERERVAEQKRVARERALAPSWRATKEELAARQRLKDELERQKCLASAKRHRALSDRRNKREALRRAQVSA